MDVDSVATSSPLWKTALVAGIAAGVQFGWALQLSLLTPYVQLLGIPHVFAAFIWLCGPISGLLVQPVVGYYSDNCKSRFGRRRPFIAAGSTLVVLAVILIGFAADIGHATGDSIGKSSKPRAIAVFVLGFWVLDVANNTLQGPCRALLADLSGGDASKMSRANSLYSFFMAVGNVLGYAAGSYNHLYQIFPWSKTDACEQYCANLKSCFLISVALLMSLTILALTMVRETPAVVEVEESEEPKKAHTIPVLGELMGALRELPRSMWMLMLVTCFNWIAWFPFLLFDTDWMGKEVYGGKVGEPLYDLGVEAGALGLMLNSVVLGVASLVFQYLAAGGLHRIKKVWGVGNFVLAAGLAMTVLISKVADHTSRRHQGLAPAIGVKAGALTLFAILGIPLAATFSIPFALASIYSNKSGVGQGLSLGVLNLAIVIPQMLVSVASGPWDNLFGGSNLPAFVVGAVAASVSGILAFILLPSPAPGVESTIVVGGLH